MGANEWDQINEFLNTLYKNWKMEVSLYYHRLETKNNTAQINYTFGKNIFLVLSRIVSAICCLNILRDSPS